MSDRLYMEEIDAFYDWTMTNDPSTGEIALWHALMSIWKKTSYAEEFSVANQVLQSRTGLSRQGVERARNGLIQMSRIMYSKGRGNRAGKYKLIPLVDVECQIIGTVVGTKRAQSDAQSGHKLRTLFSSNLVYCFCYEDIEEVAFSFDRSIMPITDNHGEIDLAIYDQLCNWLTVMSKDLVLKAIEIAVMNNGRTMAYIAKILHNWKTAGVDTLEKLDNYMAAYEKKKNAHRSNKVVPMSGTTSKKNSFHNFSQKPDKYTNEELENLLGIR